MRIRFIMALLASIIVATPSMAGSVIRRPASAEAVKSSANTICGRVRYSTGIVQSKDLHKIIELMYVFIDDPSQKTDPQSEISFDANQNAASAHLVQYSAENEKQLCIDQIPAGKVDPAVHFFIYPHNP